MKNFLLDHFFRRLQPQAPRTGGDRHGGTVQTSMQATRRELAIHASEMMGAQTYLGQYGMQGGPIALARHERRILRNLIEDTALPYLVVDPRPGLRIIDINEAYAAATFSRRREVAGEKLFDAFPDNPDDPAADGVSNLYESIQRAARTGQPHTMPVQRYDVRDADGRFVERSWRPVNIPIFDDDGRLLYLLHDAGELAVDVRDPAKGAGRRDP